MLNHTKNQIESTSEDLDTFEQIYEQYATLMKTNSAENRAEAGLVRPAWNCNIQCSFDEYS